MVVLTGSTVIKIGECDVNINDIEAIEIGDNYRVLRVVFRESKSEVKDNICLNKVNT
jgi:hypothetical protein